MGRPDQKVATYEDVLAAPEHMIAELIAGELSLQPRPAKPHTHTASVLSAEIVMAFHRAKTGPGGWWVLCEPEVHFDGDVLVPDIAGWRRAGTPDFDRTLAYYTERPDWVCEVLSPSTARWDRVKKLDVYHRAGVEWAWLVDPIAETIEVFRWSEQGWLRSHTTLGREPARLPPFDAIALELEEIWPPPPPDEA